jgi:hypothetical protein
MWFWPVKEMTELVSGMPSPQFGDKSWVQGSKLVHGSGCSCFVLIDVRCFRIPPGVHVLQVEDHCARQPSDWSASPDRVKHFLFSTLSRPAPGPTRILYDGYQALFPWGVKHPGREADHLSPTSAKVKKTLIFTSTLPYIFRA